MLVNSFVELKSYLYGGAPRFPFWSVTSSIGSPRTGYWVVVLQKAFRSAANYSARMLASNSCMFVGLSFNSPKTFIEQNSD
jgi:hypothetical protein